MNISLNHRGMNLKSLFIYERVCVIIQPSIAFFFFALRKHSTQGKRKKCSSMKFSRSCFVSSSQALTNDRYQKDSTFCLSFLLATSVWLGDRLYECLLRRFARLRKLHAGTWERKGRKNCLAFRHILRLQKERIHHTSQFLNYARRSPSLTLANNYSQKEECSSIELLQLRFAYFLANTHKRSLPERSKNVKRT